MRITEEGVIALYVLLEQPECQRGIRVMLHTDRKALHCNMVL